MSFASSKRKVQLHWKKDNKKSALDGGGASCSIWGTKDEIDEWAAANGSCYNRQRHQLSMECHPMFSTVYISLMLMTAGFVLTLCSWLTPPLNQVRRFVFNLGFAFTACYAATEPILSRVQLICLLCSAVSWFDWQLRIRIEQILHTVYRRLCCDSAAAYPRSKVSWAENIGSRFRRSQNLTNLS